MHMEARECVEGLRGTANLTGSTPGITHYPAGHMVLVPSVLALTACTPQSGQHLTLELLA